MLFHLSRYFIALKHRRRQSKVYKEKNCMVIFATKFIRDSLDFAEIPHDITKINGRNIASGNSRSVFNNLKIGTDYHCKDHVFLF